MMGALFAGHPRGEAPVKLDDPQHPLLKAFDGRGFWVRDEMYKMRDPYSRERLRVLMSFDMSKLKPDAPTRERLALPLDVPLDVEAGGRTRALRLVGTFTTPNPAASEPGSRSVTGAPPAIRPMNPLRDTPRSSGTPSP